MSDPLEARDLPEIEEILADPAASFWLQATLRSAVARDPVDAANDAEILARLLERRCRSFSKLAEQIGEGSTPIIAVDSE